MNLFLLGNRLSVALLVDLSWHAKRRDMQLMMDLPLLANGIGNEYILSSFILTN